MAGQQVLYMLRFFRGPDAALHPIHISPGGSFTDMVVVCRNFTRCELHYGHWNVGLDSICLSIGDWRHACVSQSDDGQLGKGSHVIGRGWGRLSLGWRGKKCCGPVVITDSRVLEDTYG